jgi:hypothetical protein
MIGLDRTRALRWALLLAPVLCVYAGAACTGEGDPACVPGAGRYGDRCCQASDCTSPRQCNKQRCTLPCSQDSECAGLLADGGNPGCLSDGFCAVPASQSSGGEGAGSGW